MADLDLSALEAQVNQEIAQMSEEDLAQFVLNARTKQKVQQTKQKDKMKAYQQQRNAKLKLAAEVLKKAGKYEELMKEASRRAEAILNEQVPVDDEDEEVDTAA